MFVIEQSDRYQKLSSVIKQFVLSAFSVLSALTLRDLLVSTMDRAFPKDVTSSIVFVYLHSLVIIVLAVVIAYYWS
jgi:hypothetical protein